MTDTTNITTIAWALQPCKWTKGHQVLKQSLAWAIIDFCAGVPAPLKTRCGIQVPLPETGPLFSTSFTIVQYADEADRIGICKRCQGTV